MIPHEVIERINNVAKIEEVVGDYVTLRRRGANLIGLCPFHDEKTGSFTVSPSKGIYKCFGCGASGHAAKFIMDIEQCSYVEAIKQLGRKYHIEVPEREMTPEEQQRQDDRESMFVVNDFCNRWFQSQLWDTQEGQAVGLSYFRERGLRDDIIRKFQLGYSPEKGSPLAAALKKEGFKEEYIVNNVDTKIGTGVCGKSEDGRLYDRFRDRVMFPIHTISGKTVAFAGRIMKKKENVGKYVNSPDSIVYSKTNELYGLFQAKQSIARQDLCYLVEGQMDVISMHQSGIENVVASGGTALTKPQIRLIQRFTSNITVLYDGDAAGIHAALRGIDMFVEEGFNVKVLLLPDGEDPDSYAQSHNASDFIAYIQEHQTDFIRFKSTLLKEEASGDPQKRAGLIKDVTQTIARIPDMITRQVYIKDTAEKLQINEQLLAREVVRLRRAKVEEDRKQREEKERMAAFATEEGNHVVTETTDESGNNRSYITTEKSGDNAQNRLEENYRNLLQLVIRYGERTLYQLEDGGLVTVGDYILGQLEADAVAPPNELFGRIVTEYQRHSHDEGFVAETFFKYHQDTEISALAVELIVERYQLSQMFCKQMISENVVKTISNDTDMTQLPAIVTNLLLELKLTIVNRRIDELERKMKEAERLKDWDVLMPLLQQHPQLLAVRNECCRLLGNRVVN